MKKRFALATVTTVTALLLFVGHSHQKIRELVALGYYVPLPRVFLFTECYFTCYLRDSQLFRLPECAS